MNISALAVTILIGLTEARSQITWTNLAGALGGPGGTDGSGADARFYSPSGITTDLAGNTFVADGSNQTIRKISANGTVTTIAGSPGQVGSADGPGPDARFNFPSDVAVDPNGNLYVTDCYNHTIRKITPEGIVSTIGGLAASSGYTNGQGSVARFSFPLRIAVAPDGNLIVTSSTPAIRRITPSGLVSTIAGGSSSGTMDGSGSAARFGTSASGVTVAPSGDIYVADTSNFTIRKIDTNANVSTVAGLAGVRGSQDGPVASATLYSPKGLILDPSGNLLFTENSNYTIRKLTPDGNVSTVTGTAGVAGYADGPPGTATFYLSSDLAIDPTGSLMVCEIGNQSIRKVTPSGDTITWAGTANYGSNDGTGSAAKFFDPDGIAVDHSGNVFVSDRSNNTIRRITPEGAVTTIAGKAREWGSANGQGVNARFGYPRGLAVDVQGNVFVSERDNQTIRKITPSGVVSTVAGVVGSTGRTDGFGSAARFNSPTDVVVTPSGVLFVADFQNDAIRRIAPDGYVTTYTGPWSTSNNAPFIPNSTTQRPIGLALNPDGILFVIDYSNNGILKILPDNSLSRVAGLSSNLSGNLDGLGAAAGFAQPVGIAVDAKGNAYVADTLNNTIRKITPNGWVSTIGGTPKLVGQGSGVGTAAYFCNPTSIAMGPDGAIYVANKFGNNIVKGVVSGPEIEVSSNTPPAPPVVIDSFGMRDIGAVSVGNQSTVSFTISNSGLSPLAGTAATVTGPDSADFSVTSAPATSINPAGSSTLAVTFSPSTIGSKSAVIHIASNDLDEADYTITLTAYSVAATPVGAFCWNNYAGAMGTSGLTIGALAHSRFNSPGAIAVSRAGILYVADTGNHVIRKISNSGIASTLAGQVSRPGSANGQGAFARFMGPKAVAVDANENVYVADTGNHTIRKITPDGTVTTLAGTAGLSGSLDGQGNIARFNFPSGIACDPVGDRVIVADYGNHTLRAIDALGNVSTIAGIPSMTGSTDGNSTSARFYNPFGVAVDSSGNLFICDSSNHTIRKLDTAGEVTTLAGLPLTPGSVDDQGSSARLNVPSAIVVDANGTLYFTDRSNHAVRQISPTGWVSTIGGSAAAAAGAVQGIGSAARFSSPAGIALSSEGRLFVANTGKHHIFRSTIIGADIALLSGERASIPNFSSLSLEAPYRGTASLDLLIRNVGSSTLAGLAASVMGLDAANFDMEGSLPSSIDPNGSASLRVNLSTTSPGAKEGRIHIDSNDSDEAPFEVLFHGDVMALRDYWRKSFFSTTDNFGNAADGADPDGDGIVNLVEFAFGMNPWQPSGTAPNDIERLPSASVELPITGPLLRIEYLRRTAASMPDVDYESEFSSSLDAVGLGGWNPATASESVTPIDSSWERVVIEDEQGTGLPVRFGRVRVSNK